MGRSQLSVPAQCSDAAPSGLIGPDGRWLAVVASNGSPDLVIADLDRTSKTLRVSLELARPWRARARAGTLHDSARVLDLHSSDTTNF